MYEAKFGRNMGSKGGFNRAEFGGAQSREGNFTG